MQLERIEDSVETLRPQQQSAPATTYQHGTPSHDPASSPSLSPSEGRSAVDETTSEWSLSSSERLSPRHPSDPWLISPHGYGGPSSSFYDHIYTQLRAVETANAHVDAFEGRRDSKSEACSLGDCPEEILLHIISHLPAADLLTVKLVSRRFYHSVNSPHAWMHAFSSFFPGSDALQGAVNDVLDGTQHIGDERSQRRAFTRLTATTSWTGEYLRRTKLLRCLQRGRPALPFASAVPGRPNRGMATCTFPTRVGVEVSNLHATWGSIHDKRKPLFVHGLDSRGTVTSSDRKGKFDDWGIADGNFFRRFAYLYPTHPLWGEGSGEIVGVPNIMDLAQPHGMLYAEGLPGGLIYYLGNEEKRGRVLAPFLGRFSSGSSVPEVQADFSTPTALWLAKTANIPQITGGMIGILSGSSEGVISAYSIGTIGQGLRRPERGELAARWLLSPGVPIIKILADDHCSEARVQAGRIWAVALNALGEVFVLHSVPLIPNIPQIGPEDDIDQMREIRAWHVGAHATWQMVPQTQRSERATGLYDSTRPAYLPQSLWSSPAQSGGSEELPRLATWIKKSPAEIRADFNGWEMRRRLEVDFGNSTSLTAGEAVFVIDCGSDEDKTATISRYVRCAPRTSTLPDLAVDQQTNADNWRMSHYAFGHGEFIEITATALDQSQFAANTLDEDEALRQSTLKNFRHAKPVDFENVSQLGLPGQRARLLAVGTSSGDVFVWNARASVPSTSSNVNTINPLRIIHTESPGISSVALTALYLVHGGTEGLVAAWDPLASTLEPLRTLSARKSINNRRRLVIAARNNPNFWAGTGASQFAATNISLDPDPTVLRGIVAIGGYLKYWSYSSLLPTEDETKTHKRRFRRGQRTAAINAADAFSGTSSRRSGFKNLVNEELHFRELDAKLRRADEKEDRRLAGRFGLDLLGENATEEEMLAYATLLSEESAAAAAAAEQQNEEAARLAQAANSQEPIAFVDKLSDEDYEKWKFASWKTRFEIHAPTATSSRETPPPLPQRSASQPHPSTSVAGGEDDDVARAIALSLADDQPAPQTSFSPASASRTQIYPSSSSEDADLAEAIRQSLADTSPAYTPHDSPLTLITENEEDNEDDGDDLAKAIRLSLADASSSSGGVQHFPNPSASTILNDDFPTLASASATATSSPRSAGTTTPRIAMAGGTSNSDWAIAGGGRKGKGKGKARKQ